MQQKQASKKRKSSGGVSTVRLYFATVGFVFRRFKYYILAALLFFLYFLTEGLLNSFIPEVMQKLGWLIQLGNTTLLIFLFGLISGWNKRSYLLAQIGIISYSLASGAVPDKPFRTGLFLAKERFHGVSVGKLVKKSFKALLQTVFKHTFSVF